MQNFQDTSETRKRSFINVFSIYMIVALSSPGTFAFAASFHQQCIL